MKEQSFDFFTTGAAGSEPSDFARDEETFWLRAMRLAQIADYFPETGAVHF